MELTPGFLERRIKSCTFRVLPRTTITVCEVILDNGFTLAASAACSDPKCFDRSTGEKIAYTNMLKRLRVIEDFLIKEISYAQHDDEP